MPLVKIKTGFTQADGSEETLAEYMCDIPGCPNVAEHVIGVSIELRMTCVLCADHAVAYTRKTSGRIAPAKEKKKEDEEGPA